MTKAEIYARLGIKAIRNQGGGRYIIENTAGHARPATDGEIRAIALLLATSSNER